jgi:ABC-type sugar transport system substrate-binding protein
MKREIPSIVFAALAVPALALSATAVAAKNEPPDRVTICHNTHSETNPVVIITVSAEAVQTHLTLHGDVLFVNGQCGGGGGS